MHQRFETCGKLRQLDDGPRSTRKASEPKTEELSSSVALEPVIDLEQQDSNNSINVHFINRSGSNDDDGGGIHISSVSSAMGPQIQLPVNQQQQQQQPPTDLI